MTSKQSKQPKTEKTSERTLDFQRGMLVASLLATDTSTAIQESLVHLQLISEASRVYIFENFSDPKDGLCIRQTHEACAPDVQPEIDNPDMQHLPYAAFAPHWPNLLSKGEKIGDVVANMSEAEREVFEAQDILAILIIPIFAGDTWHGFIGFDNTYKAVAWDTESVQLLQTVASLLGSHIEQRNKITAHSRSIKVSEARQTALLESLPDPTIAYDQYGQVQYLNPAFTSIFGWTLDELMGKPIEFVPEGRSAEMLQIGQEAVAHGKTNQKETQRKTKDGRLIDVSLSVAILYNADNEYDGMLVTLRDITQEKQVQADLLAYRDHLEEMVDERAREVKESAGKALALLNAIPDLMFQFNTDGVFLDYKQGHNRPLLLTPDQFLNKRAADILPPHLVTLITNGISKVTETGNIHTERYVLEQEGETRDYEARFAIGGDDLVVMLSRDITAEIEVQNMANYQADILEKISEAILSSDLNFNILSWNKAAEKLYGYTAEEVIGKPSADFITTTYLGKSPEEVLQEVYEKGVYDGRAIQQIANGREFVVRASTTLIRDADGKPAGFAAANYDITQLIETENQLLYQASLLANVSDAIISSDKDFIVRTWNKGAERMYGVSESEAIGQHVGELITTDYVNISDPSEPFNVMTSEGAFSGQARQTGPNGQEYFVIAAVSLIRDSDGEVVGYVAVNHDITHEREAQDTIRYQASLMENISDALISTDTRGTIRTWNKAAEHMYGYAAEETVGRSLREFIASEVYEDLSQEETEKQILSIVFRDGIWEGVVRQTTGKGKSIDSSVSLTSIKNDDGKIIGMIGANRDVTEIQKAQAERERLNSILENSTDYVAIANLNGDIIYQNGAGYDLLKIPTEDRQKIFNIRNLFTKKSRYKLLKEILPSMQKTGQTTWLGETEAVTLDGDILPMSQLIIAHRDTHGELEYISTVARDITEVKQAEADRNRLNSIIETTSDFVALLDLEYNLVFLNNAGAELVGREFDPAAETPLNMADLIPGHMVPMIFDQVLPQTAVLGEWSGDAYLQHKDGSEIPVSQVLTAFSENDEVAYYALVARDITLQQELTQQTEQSLRIRSRQVELTTDLAQQITSETDLNEIYGRVVNLVNEEFGYYHTQLLQYNAASSSVVLVVGYGAIGDKMLQEGHTVPVGIGLIGTAAMTGETQLSPDLTQDENWLPNPNLLETKGELAVPIKFQDQVLGVLDVQSNKINHLTQEDQVMLEGLCGQIAIAIENARLRQDMERRLDELNRLQRLMIREGWEQYSTSTETEHRGYLYDQEDVQPLLLGQDGDGAAVNPLSSLSTTSTAPLVVNPISIQGESVASIGIQDTPDNPLTEEEQDLLREISQQVGEALEKARLLEQTHKRAVELETVARVSSTTSTILQRDQLLQSVATLAKESFGLYHANVYIFEEEQANLRLIAGSGGIGELLIAEEWRVQKDDAVLPAQVVRTGKGHISNDVYQDSAYIPNPFLPETRSKLAVPMIAGGETMGVLELHSDRPNHFTNEDLQIHNTLATQTAIALQNAELFQEQLETAEKLREVDRLKSEFLASMSHELRTPLNSIIGFADVLLEGIDGELNDRMREDVLLIRNGGQHLRDLIGDILDMSKIEAGMMNLSYGKVDLSRIALEVLAQVPGMLQGKPVHIIDNIEEDIGYIQADRTRLIQILLNILTNAAKFTDTGSITLTMKRQHNFDAIISIEDTGDGIKEEDIPLVFAQFRQVGGMEHRKAGGTGLGMPITKQLVELHGGEIWLESTHGVGTTFWFTLPHEPPVRQENETQGYYA